MPASIFNSADQENIDRKIAVGLERISQALKSAIWEESKTSGLSPIQIQFLVTLNFEKHTNWTIGELSSRFALTPATVSDAVSSLVQKGFVSRSKGEEDKRTINLRLTNSGKRLTGKLGLWANALEDSVSGLEEEQKVVLLKSIIRIMQSLQAQGHVRVAHICVTCKHFQPDIHKNFRKPHHCAYLDMPFGDAELRVDCSEYEIGQTPSFTP